MASNQDMTPSSPTSDEPCANCPSRGPCCADHERRIAAAQEKAAPPAQTTPCGKPAAPGGGDPCAGCPMKATCGSAGGSAPPQDLSDLRLRMGLVKHKILVLSGKGGVGKSTFSTQLAFYLAQQGWKTGILDIDICGPSVPRMLGLEGETVHISGSGWTPVYANDNLCAMSVGFLLPSREEAVVWRGPKKNGLIKQFLEDVDWGELDFLVVDTPPGTSDEHISVTQYMAEQNPVAVILTTPQEVSLLAVRKEMNFCKKVNIPIVGVVENMSGFICPHCNGESALYKPITGGAVAMAEQFGSPFLGGIPLDPKLMLSCDEGKSFIKTHGHTEGAKAFQHVYDNLLASLKKLKGEDCLPPKQEPSE